MTDYDASREPDPALWLSASEMDRVEAVLLYHHRPGALHTEMPSESAHAAIHILVENQLALGKPAVVRATLARLVEAGLSRHEAVHAIGSVLGREIVAVGTQKRNFDELGYARHLGALSAPPWAGSAP